MRWPDPAASMGLPGAKGVEMRKVGEAQLPLENTALTAMIALDLDPSKVPLCVTPEKSGKKLRKDYCLQTATKMAMYSIYKQFFRGRPERVARGKSFHTSN